MPEVKTLVVTSDEFEYEYVINAADFDEAKHTVVNTVTADDPMIITPPPAAPPVPGTGSNSQGEGADGQNGGAGTDGAAGGGEGSQSGTPGAADGKPVPQSVKICSKWFLVDGVTGAKLVEDGFKTKGDADNAIGVMFPG